MLFWLKKEGAKLFRGSTLSEQTSRRFGRNVRRKTQSKQKNKTVENNGEMTTTSVELVVGVV